MCGIAGCIARDIRTIPKNTLQKMHASIQYRGRDDQGEWTDGRHVHLLHTRLSVIDLDTGRQPMLDASGRYVIVFNGEIYNYKELREEYEKRGIQFRTRSDTEVILAGFALKKERVCSDLNGMFAFAIWDQREKRLFLARDRLGKKPLYWCSINGAFYFASTLNAFHSIPGWEGRLSVASTLIYTLLSGFPENRTIYTDAFSLPNASYLFVKPGDIQPTPTRYWRMTMGQKSSLNFQRLLDEYESLLSDAIAIRLRSDVPIALTFSGGVDSGTIAALCANRLNFPITCYTIDYHTPENPSDETINARKVADELGLNWQYIHFDYHTDLLADLPETYGYYDQPTNQIPLVYSHRLYKAIKPHATVVLSGNGGDELFTGYIGDEEVRRIDILLQLIRPAKPMIEILSRILFPHSISQKAPLLYLQLPVPLAFFERLLQRASTMTTDPYIIMEIEQTARKIVDEALESGAHSLLDFKMFRSLMFGMSDTNYRLPDISGLAAQVEVRSPYLDYRLVEFAARLPHRFKVGHPLLPTYNKYLPKVYYSRYVPAEIAWSAKKGMGWNLRWDLSIKNDPSFIRAFEKAYASVDQAGMDSSLFRQAWLDYRNDRKSSDTDAIMMTGFMLGMWLAQNMSLRL